MSMKQTMCEFVHGMTCKEVAVFLGSIVRCRDCKHGNGGEIDNGYFKGCCFCQMGERYVIADGFCAWGERKDR